MKIAIRYYSKSGNTKRLADCIADSIGAEAYPADTNIGEDIDILFLGSSVYAGGVSGNIKSFIKSIDKKVGLIVHFGTSGTGANQHKKIRKLLEAKNLKMSEKVFHCKGNFMKLNHGHPNQEDLNNVKLFAKELITENKKDI